jgi:hypothetical protein
MKENEEIKFVTPQDIFNLEEETFEQQVKKLSRIVNAGLLFKLENGKKTNFELNVYNSEWYDCMHYERKDIKPWYEKEVAESVCKLLKCSGWDCNVYIITNFDGDSDSPDNIWSEIVFYFDSFKF